MGTPMDYKSKSDMDFRFNESEFYYGFLQYTSQGKPSLDCGDLYFSESNEK